MLITIYAVLQKDKNGNWDEIARFRNWDRAVDCARNIGEYEKTSMRVDIDTWEIDRNGRRTVDDMSEPDAFTFIPQPVEKEIK